MEKVFRSLAATLCLGLAGCDETPPAGFFPVDDSYIRTLPKEPITAIIGGGFERVGVSVDSPANCVNASKTLQSTLQAAGYEGDEYVDCIAQDGKARLIVIGGKVFAPEKLASPSP